MHEQASPVGITFVENGEIDVEQLNALYRLVDWDRAGRRTAAETRAMLEASHYHIAALTDQGALVGFARVCGDPYVAQVLDVITHPDHRRRGIATGCMRGVLAHLRRSRYVSVTVTHDRGLDEFYRRLGFERGDDVLRAYKPTTGTAAGASSPKRPSFPVPRIAHELEREWAVALAERAGVSVQEFLAAPDRHMKFPIEKVRVELMDGSAVEFEYAFAVIIEAWKAVAVFTEHCGHHVLPFHDAKVFQGGKLVYAQGDG